MADASDQMMLVLDVANGSKADRDAAAFGLHGYLVDGDSAMQLVMLLDRRDPAVRNAAARALQGTKNHRSVRGPISGRDPEAP